MRVTEIVSLLCLIYMVGVVCFAVAPFFKADGRKERRQIIDVNKPRRICKPSRGCMVVMIFL